MTSSVIPKILRLPQLLVSATVVALLALGISPPAHAAVPQLSISVDDGREQTGDGASLRYAVTVTNLGGKDVRDLHLSQTVPVGSRLDSADQDGRERSGTVRWTVDVPAGGTVTVRSALVVSEGLPPELFRLATVACAATSPRAAPTVCASDSDQLPAGAIVDQQQQRALREPVTSEEQNAYLLPSALGAGLLLVAGAVVALARRRRPASAPSGSAGPPVARRGPAGQPAAERGRGRS